MTIAPTWYALMYILGFVAAWCFLKKYQHFRDTDDLDTLFFFAGLGVILGGRLGYVLLYEFEWYLANPLEILAIWKGGMSFHGGLLGVIFAVWLFSRRYRYEFWRLIDTIAVIVPVGLGLGRFGNYLNNELYGYAGYT